MMRNVVGCAMLGTMLGVPILAADTQEPVAGNASNVGSAVVPRPVVLPKLPLSAADASLPRFEIVGGRALLPGLSLLRQGPSTQPACVGYAPAGARARARPIPTDIRATTMLLPTDVRHRVTLCDKPAEKR